MHRFLFILLFLAPACAFNQVVPRHGIGGQKSIGNKPQHDPPIVVNNYIEVLAYDICTNQLTVADGTDYFVGDTVLLIQILIGNPTRQVIKRIFIKLFDKSNVSWPRLAPRTFRMLISFTLCRRVKITNPRKPKQATVTAMIAIIANKSEKSLNSR